MAETAVVNASPLIYLSRAGLVDLLRLAGKEVFVPDLVAKEILARGPADLTATTVRETPWLTTSESLPVPASVLA